LISYLTDAKLPALLSNVSVAERREYTYIIYIIILYIYIYIIFYYLPILLFCSMIDEPAFSHYYNETCVDCCNKFAHKISRKEKDLRMSI